MRKASVSLISRISGLHAEIHGFQRGFPRDARLHSSLTTPAEENRPATGASAGTPTTNLREPSYRLYSWGKGFCGVLGHDSDEDEYKPRQLAWRPELEGRGGLVSVVSGLYHAAAVTRCGELYIWGRGSGGRLGQGDEDWAHRPQLLRGLKDLIESNHHGEIASVSLGGLHSAVLTTNGQVYTWGHAGFGQTGHPSYKSCVSPRLLVGPREGEEFEEEGRCSRLASGGAHMLALMGSGHVYSWGRDLGEGRLGLPPHVDSLVLDNCAGQPMRIPQLRLGTAADVACGGFASYAIPGAGLAGDEGGLLAWGANANGELGLGHTMSSWVPERMIGPLASERVAQVNAGGYHALAVTEEGAVYSWGDGTHGQLGHGDRSRVLEPRQLAALRGERVVQVECGGSTSFAVTAGGRLLAFGSNKKGDMGLGMYGVQDAYDTPQEIPIPGGGRVLQVAAGAAHAIALVEEVHEEQPKSAFR